ncbi:hypothetical protein FO519_005419 [Halicephalobus sp. NKZ332]|nr:hypothetical protein FO519_005419 [Halicephalobus sp. NKZ332]
MTETKISEDLICEEILEVFSDHESTSESDHEVSFINWLHSFPTTCMMIYVDEDFIRDGFNRQNIHKEIGISERQVNRLVEKILEGNIEEFDKDEKTNAIDIYGLVHARFIVSPYGIDQMRLLFSRGAFGKCPRHFCADQNCLPMGETPRLGQSPVKIFCPRCKQIYEPKHYYDLDGAYFGPSFPAAFMLEFPNLCPPPPVQMPFKFPINVQKRNPCNDEVNENSAKTKNC